MRVCRCCEAFVGALYLMIFFLNLMGVRKRYCCICLRYAGSYESSSRETSVRECSEDSKDVSITIDKHDT